MFVSLKLLPQVHACLSKSVTVWETVAMTFAVLLCCFKCYCWGFGECCCPLNIDAVSIITIDVAVDAVALRASYVRSVVVCFICCCGLELRGLL